jgi:hypothetical protein
MQDARLEWGTSNVSHGTLVCVLFVLFRGRQEKETTSVIYPSLG